MSRRLAIASLGGLLAAGLLAIGLHTAGAAERPRTQDAGNAERGQRLFLVGCAYCHGQNGEGTAQGPDLRGVGAAAADFQLSTGRMPNTAPDRQSVTKRSPYTRAEIDDLVAYVASLGPGPPIPDVHNPPGDLQEGGELYLDNCAACHSAAGNGGALSVGRDAPTLHGATPVEVAEAVRTGPGNMPVFGPGTFTPQQVNSIVRYVEYLKKPQDPGGLSLGLVGPITEGLVAILVGLGALMLITRWIEPPAMRQEPPAVTAPEDHPPEDQQ
jgi:ubiquinol-cytochrome c reductase cytochrome c subunit